MKRWPNRKLTKAEGERILWHAIEHLRGVLYDLAGEAKAIETCRKLLEEYFQ